MVAAASKGIRAISEARERVLAGEAVQNGARSQIVASWQRCRFLGLNPDRLPDTCEQDVDMEGRLTHAADPVLEWLMSTLAGESVSIILTDARARVLRRMAGSSELHRHLDRVHLAPGLAFSEQFAGTNGIGTTLQDRQPRLVVGSEHFADRLHPFACAGTPIRDPLSGDVEGILDLTCFRDEANAAMMPLVRQAAAHIEQRLLEEARRREKHLLAAFLESEEPALFSRSAQNDHIAPADPAEDVVSRHDLVTLRDRAAELISAPASIPILVRLDSGHVATLRCREVTGDTGETGVAVLATLPDGRHGSRTTASPPTAPGAPVPASPADLAVGTEPPVGADGRLLLIGEPGVGRFAVLARERLELLYEASIRIGTTLDVPRTAEELAEISVPRFADFTAIDLPEQVLHGDEPVPGDGIRVDLRRVALSAVREDSHLYPVGRRIGFAPTTPQARCLATLQPVFEPVLSTAFGWIAQDEERAEQILDAGVRSLFCVPLQARGVVLGVVTFYRSEDRGAFEEDDLSLVADLVHRAAICIDNARRFTREHTMALALQHRLLPRDLPEQHAMEVAHRYLPAQSRVGGDWYDVIPLSGARVALVVGDVVGHGVPAAATMGLLRTAVHNFSALDLPADELLAQLDDLVVRLSNDERSGDAGREDGIIGATCLYAVYDPTDLHCTMARAGHPPPALVAPDGTVEFPQLPEGPPLGLGKLPFETVEMKVPEGSLLVLYTDGLVEDRHRDIGSGLEQLRKTLADTVRTPEHTCDAVLKTLLPTRPTDDVALLVGRTRALDTHHIARWDLACDPSIVSLARAEVLEQLAQWGLAELSFATELIVSELVTNAVRYGGEPIQLRLLRDRALICEVSDGSNTSPRLRRAGSMDEGGRGLFLVTQLAERWGTRYATRGKVIWTEQPLP